ncbi:translation elongation factor Ts [bacterium]|nr:translation elongation factor Ts [bacterium]
MPISAELVKELRKLTGAPLMDCKKALEKTGGDIQQAMNVLREKGIAVATKRSGKEAREGIIVSYIHHSGKVGVLLELNCETDFVARTDEFKQLAHDLAMQVAAMAPTYISREDVPPEVLEQEKEVLQKWAESQGKPPKAVEKMVEGRLENFFANVCLLEQPFIKDEEKKVKDVIAEAMGKIGEKIAVGRFTRYEIGEG